MFILFQQAFVQNAFIAGTIIALVAAVVGYFVVIRCLAFAGDSLSHIGFAGATGAFLFGLTSLIGAFIFTVLAALSYFLSLSLSFSNQFAYFRSFVIHYLNINNGEHARMNGLLFSEDRTKRMRNDDCRENLCSL